MKNFSKNQSGVAHVALLALVVVVIGAVGFVGWKVYTNKNSSGDASTEVQKAARDDCEKENDKDICKFLTSWNASGKYRMTTTEGGEKSVFEVDGDKTRILIGGEKSYEVITIDKTTYTKAGSVWYKQTIKDPKENVSNDYKMDFEEPAEGEETKNTTTYKSLGKEACGDLQCFKYEVVDSERPKEKQYFWFDDKDYLLRKIRTESNGAISEQVYEYDNVSISEPSPVKELKENQYILPGASEPVTMPSIQ